MLFRIWRGILGSFATQGQEERDQLRGKGLPLGHNPPNIRKNSLFLLLRQTMRRISYSRQIRFQLCPKLRTAHASLLFDPSCDNTCGGKPNPAEHDQDDGKFY